MAQIDKIDPKLELWLSKPDLELTDLDNNKSIKTNFMLAQRNFLNIKKWASGVLAYLRYLRNLIDIDSIVSEVFEKLRTQKMKFYITAEHDEILTYSDSTTGYDYTIKYVDQYTVEITSISDKNFVTDEMCITVKNSDNVIVYPVVQTGNNMIKLYFPDEIHDNYVIYVV